MKSQAYPILIQPGQIYDETTNSKIRVVSGQIVVENMQTGTVQKHLLPPLRTMNEKSPYGLPLKFVNKSSNVSINPTGNVLTCKSFTFQEVEMNKSFSKQIALWSLYIPQKTPLLSVGIKSHQHKKSLVFDFSISKPSVLTFKVDLESKTFSCWFNGVKSFWHKPQQIEHQGSWTPFVRVKNIGTNIILNSLVSDPQNSTVSFVNSTSKVQTSQFIEPQLQKSQLKIQQNTQAYSLHKLSNDKILLTGENTIKILNRSQNSSNFVFDFVQFSETEGKFLIPFTIKQFENLTKFSKKVNASLLLNKFNQTEQGNYILSCTKEEWTASVSKTLQFLNHLQSLSLQTLASPVKNSSKVSIQQINSIAQILLQKISSMNVWLDQADRIDSYYLGFSKYFSHTKPLHYFDNLQTSFTIPKQISLNNLPFIKFNGTIASVKSPDSSFVACLMKQGNRISILNVQQIPFKLIDTVMSRGFAKQSEINQYKKQIQDIKDSDFSKPHIFKILKNCLKYADKIKPPEKLLQEIQKKKQIIVQKKALKQQKQKKPKGLQADKSLLNTLVTMGFNQKLSTKVLVECKNQSLQAAIQLILNKYKDENVPASSKNQGKNKPNRQWQCQICTLINSKDNVNCSACQFPAPVSVIQETLIQQKIEQEKIMEQQKIIKEEQISSESIQNQAIKNFFVWSTGIVYCPILVAAVFENKIRFRIVGPNPKFYSNFYLKDGSYFDLTTLRFHQHAHQIDKTQINHLFYLTNSSEELRKANWGWMNIEDQDISFDGNVENIQFVTGQVKKKQKSFTVNILAGQQSKSLQCRIVYDNVYQEKKRCLIMDAGQNIQNTKSGISQSNILTRKSSYLTSDQQVVSKNQRLIANFSYENTQQIQESFVIPDYSKLVSQRTSKQDLLPLIAINGSYNSQLKYPNSTLQSLVPECYNSVKQFRNGIVFQHVKGKSIRINSIKLEQKTKRKFTNAGFLYLANDLNKLPLIKHQFQFSQDGGKTTISLNGEQGKYLVLVLHAKQNQQKVQIQSVFVYGQVVQIQEKPQLNLQFLKQAINMQFLQEQFNKNSLNELVKIDLTLKNFPYDILVSQEQCVLELIKNWIYFGITFDIQATISLKNKQINKLNIKSIKLQNWQLVTSHTEFYTTQIQTISQSQYQTYLQSFILTGDNQYFDLLRKQQNKEYRKIVSEVDLNDFIFGKLITCPYQKKQKNKFKNFINIFGHYLNNNKTINSQSILQKALQSENLTAYGAELLFSLLKAIDASQTNYLTCLNQQVKSIEKRKHQTSIQGSKFVSQSYIKQNSIFSDYLLRLHQKDKSSQKIQQNQIHYHYLCQKGSNKRKYIVDMMSMYSLDKLALKFESSKDKSKLDVVVEYISQQGKQHFLSRQFYDQHIWSQICGHYKGAHSLQLNLNKIKTRYLIFTLSFSAVPYSHNKKQQQNLPLIEIVPIIYGSYVGESQAYLSSQFDLPQSKLHLVKKVQGFSKYSLKQSQSICYYNSQELSDNNSSNVNLEDLQKKQDNLSNRQQIVNILMKRPSRDNLNFNFTLTYLLIDAALNSINLKDLNTVKLSEDFIRFYIENLINTQRGPIFEKSIQLLKKIISVNKQVLLTVLHSRILSENAFNQLFKDLKIQDNQNLLISIDNLITKKTFQQHKSLVLNLAWLSKIYTFDKSRIQRLVQSAFEANSFDQLSIIFDKYGWTNHTTKVLNSLIQNNSTQKFISIVSSSKVNKELCDFAFEQLKLGNTEIFEIVMNEISQKSRNTKINELKEIILYILTNVVYSAQDESQKVQDYLYVLSLINRYGHTLELSEEVLKAFFRLQQKNPYINELLSCTFLKSQKQQELLLKTTLVELSSLKSLKKDDLSLLNDILVFLLNKQISLESNKSSFILQKQTQEIALSFFSNFLHNYLNIGGLQSVKLVDESLAQKIKITFYLSSILQSQKVFEQIKDENFQVLINWLILNITTSEKNIKTPNCSRFLKIQQLVWNIIEMKGKSSENLFAKIYIKVYKELKSKFSLIQNLNLRYNFYRKIYVYNTKVLQKLSSQQNFLKLLLKENGLFMEILNEFSSLDSQRLSQLTENQEVQLVNEFSLYPENKQSPKDWLLYKNGAKNHVHKIEYSQGNQQVVDLVFSHQEQFTLSKVIFAFKIQYSSVEKNICLPKQIKVQGGASLDKMKFLGEMFEIRDDKYLNYSVKLFGLNTNNQKSVTNIQLHCNKNIPIRYLKFRIRSPQPVSIEDALSVENSDQKSSVSYINFLSVQGFKQKNASPYTQDLVRYLQLLTKVDHKELVNNLFNTEQVMQSFKKALLNISFLMKNDKYEKTLHNFLMRICEQNTSIGNQMIDKYLQLQNGELCSKISAQIVLSNDKHLSARTQLYFEFISKSLLSSKQPSDKIIPFLNRFIQISFYAMSRNKYQQTSQIQKIKLEVNPQIVQQLLVFLQEENGKSQELLQTSAKFLKNLITLSDPFQVTGFELKTVLQHLYTRKNKTYDQILASLIIDHTSSRQWFMQNKYFQKSFEQTFNLIKTSANEIDKINRNLQFLTILTYNSNIKQLINKYQYNLLLFEMLMSKNYQAILSKSENQSLRRNFVNLIVKTSLGSENQTIIASLLKDSIPNIISQGNEKFVGEIFLPLLNSYQKVSVCVLPYSQAENKLITDISNSEIDTKSGSDVKNVKLETSKQNTFRLPSTVISDGTKEKIFEQLKKSAYSSGNFNLAFNHGTCTVGLGESIQNKLFKGTQPFLTIFRTKSTQANTTQTKSNTVCIFYNRPKSTNSSTTTKLSFQQGSFIILNERSNNGSGNITVIDKAGVNQSMKLIEFNKTSSDDYQDSDSDDSDQSQLNCGYNGSIFIQISYTYENQNYFNFSALSKNKDMVSSKASHTLESAQFWVLEQTTSHQQSVISSTINTSSLTKTLLSSQFNHELFNSQYLAAQSINYLRYEKVYEFPSSISVSQLKESLRILNCSIQENKLQSLKIKLVGSKQNLTDESTLQEIKKKNKSYKDSILLDINMPFDNILQFMNMKNQNKKQQVDFLPRKPILKYFEEHDGIQAMIKVIKKSIQSWNNKVRMEKWLQYVTELENFSHFPHFFAIYLKDKETFNLLFNLLASLPDKQTDPKWDQLQSASSQKLLKIVSEILHMDKTSEFRQYALKNSFFVTILQRLRILTGLFKRKFDKDFKEDQDEQQSPNKNAAEDDGTKKIKKKKGVGYGNDTSSNTKWMKQNNIQTRKKQFQVVGIILNIIQNFLDIRQWKMPTNLIENIYESSLLPFIEDGLRAGTLLQISKHPQKFKIIFKIIKVFAKHQKLVPILLPLSNNYQPRQIESIQSLLKGLENTAVIFLSCLNQNKSTQTKEQQTSQELANLIKETYFVVEQAIEQYKQKHQNDQSQQKVLQEILQLPLDKKYRQLMKDLRFDYIDMKESPNKIKHHYSSSFTANYTPNQVKMIRLAQQLADISTALPHEHTNAIYVRCDKDRVDFMQALIMGANGTPYGHGAFLFDVYFDDNYPNGPPKVNLTTTGHGKVRFNPNLYACGKVCLSLLGTWRGSASENWDAKVSTLLQTLLSIQAIIMSEQVYFNEPGFQNQQGTQQGQKKNQAYSNIVRYCNIKFAMIDNIKNPPKGFETIIRRHFYLKKDQIMQECRKWQKYAEKRPANYIGLVNDHNHSWSNEFKKTKTTYKEMLDQAIKQLQEQLNKLPAPKITDISTTKQAKKTQKKKKDVNKMEQLQKQQQQDDKIDVSYDKNKISQAKQIDITDEKVKDRWSRYIGAMGIDAVSKQSKADILMFGLGPLGLEVVKNLVLSGCRKLTICDDELVKLQDLSGGFFYTQEDVGKKRIESILYKIRQLNVYVKIDTIEFKNVTPDVLKTYSLVLATQIALNDQRKIADICRQNKVKFISADSIGFTCRIINDLGQKFEVLDKNGQEPVEVFVKQITNEEKGIVTLLDGVKNPFQDGQAVLIRNIQGMKLKDDQGKSINDTIHKVKVINSKSFEIGSTLGYTPYIRNGTIKNIKTPVQLSYKPFSEVVLDNKNINVDENLSVYDFAKLDNIKLIKSCYLTLDEYKRKNQGKWPQSWNEKDCIKFVQIFKTVHSQNVDQKIIGFVHKFALTCRGYLPPLCAFFGGVVCQQVIKAITQKFKPILSQFYIQFNEIVPQIPAEFNQKSIQTIFSKKQSRDLGFQIVIGSSLLQVIKDSKLFMIGSGAIGCELLKNFAMISFGTGQKGKITITDPDHIQNSNLNRQFLFRQKHISKSKSRTASEAVKIMNPQFKNHIVALTERVSDTTKDIFTNKFFQGLTLVANALDNVAARRYVDQRCVQNKIPLFESGTLGPKGHVQVIIPYLTQSYGSQNDPVEQGQIPHCTLKMFPQETLHCVQWARDIFGKKFSLQPKALLKIIDKSYKPQKDDIKALNDCVTMVKKGPKKFEDCISYAIHKFYKYYRDDIMQLLYTYPLDAKTKNGQPFWKLPKRPPTPIMLFDPENILQCTFVTSLAVMVAKIYQIQYPKNFRTQIERFNIGKMAVKIKVPDFVASDQKAKEILKQSSQKKQENVQEQKIQTTIQQKDENQLYKEIITTGGNDFKIKAEEFQKDDDANGHIDFIYSMSNLRAINYKLDPLDWINVKIKAGRIVPALATTTACVSGLQTLQICKYLKKIKIDLMKNSYLNLAVPSLQMSEPGEVLKKKITQKLTVNLWDRWQVECQKSSTFGNLYEKLHKIYEIFPIGVLQGMSRIDTGKTQEAKKAFLNQKILDKLDMDQNYIDIIVLFTKSPEDDKIIEGVPPARLIFI